MKNRKNVLLLAVMVSVMMIGFHSCSQYPDNDSISLVSKTERVSGAWKVENYKINDVDYTSLVTGYTETFTNNGAYSYQWGVLGGNGTWVFQNNDAEIQITGLNNQKSTTLFIQKLEEKQFWYYYFDGSDKKEFHMIQL